MGHQPLTLFTTPDYCVYAHLHDGEIFYIGKGRIHRAFSFFDRNDKWTAFVSAIPSYDVEILFRSHDKYVALREEARLLKLFQPRCNITHEEACKKKRRNRYGVEYDPDDYTSRRGTLT